MSQREEWRSKMEAMLEVARDDIAPLSAAARLKVIWPYVLRLIEDGHPYSRIRDYLREGGLEISSSHFRTVVSKFRANPPSSRAEVEKRKIIHGSDANVQSEWEPQKKFEWNSKSTDDVFRTGKSNERRG